MVAAEIMVTALHQSMHDIIQHIHPGTITLIIKYASRFILILFVAVFMVSCKVEPHSLIFRSLKCDHFTNPIGIENFAPRFSWIVEQDEANRSQSAYRILVASSDKVLRKDKGDIWDSGKITSSASIYNIYAGSPLQPCQRYFWKVMIWNQDGEASGWSPTNYFETGLRDDHNWENARWIRHKSDGRQSEHRFRNIQTERMDAPVSDTSYPTGYFRKEFLAEKIVKSARIYVAALGYYELFINGERVGDEVLNPSATSYDRQAFYTIHDVTQQLGEGVNALGLILGNGFYGQNLAFYGSKLEYGRPAFKLVLKLEYEDDTKVSLVSDESWKSDVGPIVFDNVYAGETYDARFEQQGWDSTGFDDSQWNHAEIASPEVGKLRSQLLPPISRVKTLEPKKIFESINGDWVVDFGQNISGWIKIKVKGSTGQVIKLTLAEALTRDRSTIHNGSVGKFATGVLQEDIYICKGNQQETWEPRFTYHGFQFALISGLSQRPGLDEIQAVVVHTDLQETGTFESSDTLLNKMVEVSKWTVLGNAHSFPEDCPHREKCGWLGDAQVTAEFCHYHFDAASFYDKYMLDIQSNLVEAQPNRHSDKTYKVPTMVAPGRRKAGIAKLDWGIALIYLPWYQYLHTGDFSLIERHYSEMIDLVSYYLSFKNADGIIENGLGDWCPPRWDRYTNPGAMECDPYISATAYFYDILQIMERVALQMDQNEYAMILQEEKMQLKRSFNEQFLRSIGKGGALWYGSQTATVMALRFGMVNESDLSMVLDGLKYDILENKGGHHSTGIHGSRYIYTVLANANEPELANQILTAPDFPSQAYIINSGLTTWPERQWEWDSGIEWNRSLNHPMQGGFAAHFYETLAGVQPMPDAPGFKEFIVEPVFLPNLDYAKASIQSPYGQIDVHWEKSDNDAMVLNVTVPFNSQAHLNLPVFEPGQVQYQGHEYPQFFRNQNKISALLEPGAHQIKFPMN